MDDDRRRMIDERINLVTNNDPSATEIRLGRFEPHDQIRVLFRGLQQNSHVQKLNLHDTPRGLRRTVCQQLLPPLLRENSSIEYLRFPKKMTNADFLPSAVEIILRGNNSTVKDLDLTACDIRDGEGGEIIAGLMQNINNRITTIGLHLNENLGPAGAARIAAALSYDNCTLKTLDLSGCGIRDEGMAAMCAALRINTSLEKAMLCFNGITQDTNAVWVNSLPHMTGLKEIQFQFSVGVFQEMMEALLNNHSLQVIRCSFIDAWSLPLEQGREWDTCRTFVCARNKMNDHFDKVRNQTRVAVREGSGVAPVPIPNGPLLWWCRRQGNSEVQASLMHPLLRSRANEIAKFAEARTKPMRSKRKRGKVDYLHM